jgi:ubiquinone/menaquinone biosynthesis C-methylase UbiE
MIHSRKFDPHKKAILDDPVRMTFHNPDDIWAFLRQHRPKVLIDIGAGTGFFAIPFSRKISDGIVYACDISDEMLEELALNLAHQEHGDVRPVKMEESRVPLPDDLADLVYLINVYHELETPQQVIRESHRLLKQGGMIAVIDWKKTETPYGPPLSIRVSNDVIRSAMLEGGFSDIDDRDILHYHCFLTGKK